MVKPYYPRKKDKKYLFEKLHNIYIKININLIPIKPEKINFL